ncbi:MAG: YfhO family protein, partial [Clostridia bacterium]|nr:YfhO family protein [Clostridia bacterium]
EAMKTLVNSSTKIIKRNETNLEITAGIGREGLLFTTIPYDKGWRIEVNGKRTEGLKVLDSLLGIPIETGDNKISLRFIPYGSIPAFGISLVTLGVFIFFVIKKRRRVQLDE